MICYRKIKAAGELEAATKLAQQEETARLQRLQEVQEQAVLDLRLYRQNIAPTFTSLPVPTEPAAIKSEVPSAMSLTTALPPPPISSNSAGVKCFDSFVFDGFLFYFLYRGRVH